MPGSNAKSISSTGERQSSRVSRSRRSSSDRVSVGEWAAITDDSDVIVGILRDGVERSVTHRTCGSPGAVMPWMQRAEGQRPEILPDRFGRRSRNCLRLTPG
jgi:hypothetical protein